MSTTHRKSSKSTSAPSGSRKTSKTTNVSESVALEPVGMLLLSAAEIEQQLGSAVDGDLSHKHLQEALHNAQELVGKFKAEVKRLSTRVADLELSQNSSVKKSAENELHTEITKLGASFQFLYSPFQKANFDLFSSNHQKPTFGPHDPARYANTSNIALGPIAELYTHVDKKFHLFMIDGEEFGDIFLASVSNARSSSVERLKSVASTIFDLGAKKNLFGRDSEITKERMENPRVQKLLGLDLPLDHQVVPPLLYFNEDATDIMKLFLNPVLLKMARIVLYGPSMAEKPNASLRASSPFRRANLKVTPGIIAWCSVIARYLLSPDTELSSSGIGFHSKYNYPGDFENYKMMIVIGRDNNRSWYRKLMNTWNKSLFPAKTKGGVDDDSEEDPAIRSEVIGASAVTDLMQRMKIAGSNTISNSGSESSESGSSESDASGVVAQQRNRRPSSLTEDSTSDSDAHGGIPPVPLLPSLPPQPQPRPRPLTQPRPMTSDDDSHIISYATSLPPPPRPRPSTQNLMARATSNSNVLLTSLPPPPRPRPSTQNLMATSNSNVVLAPTPGPARLSLERFSPALDLESRQTQNIINPPDSPLSDLDMQPVIPNLSMLQPTAQAPKSKVGNKPRTQKQDHSDPPRRSNRSKAAASLNAAEHVSGPEGSRKGKGRSRKSGD